MSPTPCSTCSTSVPRVEWVDLLGRSRAFHVYRVKHATFTPKRGNRFFSFTCFRSVFKERRGTRGTASK